MTVAVMGKAFPLSYKSLLAAAAAADRIAAPAKPKSPAPALLFAALALAGTSVPAAAVSSVNIGHTAPSTTATVGSVTATTFDTQAVNIVRMGRMAARAPVSQVPEPAVWTMLVAGFGLVGASRRRARVVAC